MFVETITVPEEVWHRWADRLRLLSEPPTALFASIAWNNVDGTITAVNVWDSPSAVADFFIDRVEPMIAAEGQPDFKPVRHGEPISSYFRHECNSKPSAATRPNQFKLSSAKMPGSAASGAKERADLVASECGTVSSV
jgi:hypothetical protein